MAAKDKAKQLDQPVQPAEIIEREDSQRKPAAYMAVASAILTAVAVIIEQIVAGSGVPDFQQADIAATMAATQNGTALPPSFLSAVGEFKIDHAMETIAVGTLRGIAVLLLIPIILLLARGARDRGAPLPKVLDPIVVAGLAMVGVLAVVTAVLEPAFYREARDAGFSPEAIRDAYRDSELGGAPYLALGLFAPLMAGIPTAMAALQASRVGLLPRLIGFMGVAIGILFVMPVEPTGLLRSFYFASVAFVVMGLFADGLPEAWKTGTAVEPAPRQPRDTPDLAKS